MNHTLAWLKMSKVEDLTHKQIQYLLEVYKTPENIVEQSVTELQKVGLTEKQSKQMISFNPKELQQEMEQLKQKQICFITIEDEFYPKQLKEIYDFPYWIYAKGNSKILQEESIAIIGSRNCSLYGQKVATRLAYQLAKQNKHIVSGMARGIDTFGHIGCIKAKGKTIAVLGSGIDIIYPKENEKLYYAILEAGGTILSEYPLGTQPLAQHFPARNRIISGLCHKMIVVEAGERSGSFITVNFALEQGKEVYAVPGNITSPYSKRNQSVN